MAKYNRKILVPYLNDVCSVEILCSKLRKEVEQCRSEVYYYADIVNTKIIEPVKPQCGRITTLDKMCLIGGLGLVILGILILDVFLLAILLIGVGGLMLLCSLSGPSKDDLEAKYQEEMQIYIRQVENYPQLIKKRSQAEVYFRDRKELLSVLTKRLTSAEALLKELYSANIIPSKYRNIYAAYYLYDYFSTSREDDLDKIIQTLLLDEIVQRLGTIIEQNKQILLNQRVQIALQEQSNRMQAENHREQMEHIARMEQNQELQLDYQNLIVQHQRATNFFLAADYLYKRR